MDWLTKAAGSNQVIRFQSSEEARRLRPQAQQESSRTEASSCLKLAMGLYLQQYRKLAKSYDAHQKLKVLSEIVALKHELKNDFDGWINKPYIVAYIKHRLLHCPLFL